VRNVVFVNDVAGQPAVLSHGKSLPLGPGAYHPAALPASCRSGPDPRPLRAHAARVFHEGSQLTAELGSMAGAQVYLVFQAIQAELHRLVGGAASEIIL
jgi:hypothetical protein